jgi:hypothetical protein
MNYFLDPGAHLVLTMIMKNEEHVLERCLKSLWPFLSGFFIHDTGSDPGDRSKEIVKEILWDIPGVVTDEKWVNYAHNRNRVKNDAAQMFGHDVHFLAMDCDDILMDEGFDPKRDLTHPVMSIGRGTEDMRNWPEIIHMSGYGEWVGPIHETFMMTTPAVRLKTAWIKIGSDGARAKNLDKFKDDAKMIEDVLSYEKDPAQIRKLKFHLAQAHQADGNLPLAEALTGSFLKDYPNIHEELEWNALLRLGCIKEQLHRSISEVINIYHLLIQTRSHRVEPYVLLANYLLANGMPHAALEIAEIACRITEIPEQDTLCIMNSFYTQENRATYERALAIVKDFKPMKEERL